MTLATTTMKSEEVHLALIKLCLNPLLIKIGADVTIDMNTHVGCTKQRNATKRNSSSWCKTESTSKRRWPTESKKTARSASKTSKTKRESRRKRESSAKRSVANAVKSSKRDVVKMLRRLRRNASVLKLKLRESTCKNTPKRSQKEMIKA